MYALSKSILYPFGEYRLEGYRMEFFDYDISVIVELKIFGEEPNALYMAEYQIIRGVDDKTTWGACTNRPTKESAIEAVEAIVSEIMEDKKHYWD